MDFKQAGDKFRQLKARFEAKQLTEAEFKAQLQDLMVQDGQGDWWMIGYETERWYRHDGTKWVQTDPPTGSLPQEAAPLISPKPETMKSTGTQADSYHALQAGTQSMGPAGQAQQSAKIKEDEEGKAHQGMEAQPVAIREPEEGRMVRGTAIAKPVAKEESFVGTTIGAEKKTQASQSDKKSVSPGWIAVFWITLGWVISAVIFRLGWGYYGFVVSILAGALGGLITAITLRSAGLISNWRSMLGITLGWAAAAFIAAMAYNPIGPILGGALGGFIIAITLRSEGLILDQKNLMWIILGWAVGWWIGWWIARLVFAIGGLIGGLILIWRVREAKRQMPPVPESG